MPQFDINQLVVLHLYNYIKPNGEQDPLSIIEKTCKVMKLSTCMRVIYILKSDSLNTEEQLSAYNGLIDYLKRKDGYSGAITFERIDGEKAYEFLLYWMIGGINPKKTFDDQRILGDVRALWTKTQRSTSVRIKELVEIYTNLFQILFTDSVNLGKLIKVYEDLDLPELTVKLKMACFNCSWTRSRGFLDHIANFDYQYFAENSHLNPLESHLESKLKGLLSKTEFSSTGTDVCFFKSKYEISEEQLGGISVRIKTVKSLLQFLNTVKKGKYEVEVDNPKVNTCSDTKDKEEQHSCTTINIVI